MEQGVDERPLTRDERRRALEFIARRQKYYRWAYFEPYVKQRQFLDLGASKRERLFMAGNRLGKTQCGAYEATCHATGQYPKWWRGKRFPEPTVGWVCGMTALAVRDVCQVKMCGPFGVEAAFGTGMIPKDCLLDKSLSRGVSDALDTIHVKHVTGGTSIVSFKSYEQGREKFQGAALDWVWFDEEPDGKIYGEGLTRIGERLGVVFVTFTPMNGRHSDVVMRFLDEPSSDRAVVTMALDELPEDGHIKPADRAAIVAGYAAHEREARAKGVPFLGSGRIFTATEESICEPAIEHVPAYWGKLWGIDPGISHPFGAVLMLWDRDNDVLHVHHTVRMSDATPAYHAMAMKPVGAGVPVAFPKDAFDRDMGSGIPLAAQYKKHGLLMLGTFAKWDDGSVSTEAGIMEMQERFASGRLKVARHLSDWLEEYRMYHRKDGQIVKMRDDLMSATRVAVMMKREARNVPLGAVAGKPVGEKKYADGLDFDLFAT
jgi:phage terminase large subunit-like protein